MQLLPVRDDVFGRQQSKECFGLSATSPTCELWCKAADRSPWTHVGYPDTTPSSPQSPQSPLDGAARLDSLGGILMSAKTLVWALALLLMLMPLGSDRFQDIASLPTC